MPDIQNWIEQADHYRSAFALSLVSIERFNSALLELVALDSSPCTNIHIAVQMAAPFGVSTLGSEGVGDAAQAQAVPNVDEFGTRVRISIWKCQDFSGDLTEIGVAVVTLFKAFWKAQLRSSKSWLVSNENSERANLIDKTLESVFRGTLAAFLYCDLDNFKSANDSLGHVAGDRIIREFGALVESAASPGGIALHRSGDEFLILASCSTIHQPLQIAKHLHDLVRSHDFCTDAITIDVKIGIAVFDGAGVVTYHDLERLAESATLIGGEKQRGRARFASVGSPEQPPQVDRSSLDTALVLLKSGLGMREPFANPWLNLISQEVEVAVCGNGHPNKCQAAVTKCLEWIRPDFLDGVLSAAKSDERAVPQHPTFSQLDVALAVAHAACRAFGSQGVERTLLLRFNKAANFVELRIEPDSTILFTGGLPEQDEAETDEYDLGAIPRWEGQVPPEDTFKRAVLVRIGHDAVNLPSRAFRDIVVVDDRPARGGGLPDFWESALARLIAYCDSSPNVGAVFVWGNERYAPLIWAKIGDIPNWPSELDILTFRTGANRASLSRVAERLASSIFRSGSADQLLPELAGVYRRPIILKPFSQPGDVDDTRFLVRRLDSTGFALSKEDGCRARSIAQAFPLVLEIVRKAANGGRIVDQAGQELNELVDFKVHVDEPLDV